MGGETRNPDGGETTVAVVATRPLFYWLMIGPPIGVGPGASAQASPCIKAALALPGAPQEIIVNNR